MRPVKFFYFFIAFIICVLIAVKSFDYVNPYFTTGYLSDKKAIFSFYKYFLYAHILGAPIAFLVGLVQFTFERSKYHQWFGYVYVVAVLLLASPGGLVMSFYAIGGIPSIVNFALLSSLWTYFTLVAFREIRKGKVASHKTFMTRSFILANSAILIRILSFVNNKFNLLDSETGYILIGWLSWLPALLVFEYYNKSQIR